MFVCVQTRFHYSVPLSYDAIIRDRHRAKFKPGCFTDDMAQTVCLLDTLLQQHDTETGIATADTDPDTSTQDSDADEKLPALPVTDFARRLKSWSEHGLPELGDTSGYGVGDTVSKVLDHKRFLVDPLSAAQSVYDASEHANMDGNGAVMRTAPIGIMYAARDSQHNIDAAKHACAVTHASPKCQASCIAVSHAIRMMLRGEVFATSADSPDAASNTSTATSTTSPAHSITSDSVAASALHHDAYLLEVCELAVSEHVFWLLSCVMYDAHVLCVLCVPLCHSRVLLLLCCFFRFVRC